MTEVDPLQERLRKIQQPPPRPPLWRRLALPAGMLAAGLAGGAYVATVVPSNNPAPAALPTSEVREFQDDTGQSGGQHPDRQCQAPPQGWPWRRLLYPPQAFLKGIDLSHQPLFPLASGRVPSTQTDASP